MARCRRTGPPSPDALRMSVSSSTRTSTEALHTSQTRVSSLAVPIPTLSTSPKAKSPPSPSSIPPTGPVLATSPTPGYAPLSRSTEPVDTPSRSSQAMAAVPTTLPVSRPFPIVGGSSAPSCFGVTERASESSYSRDHEDLESIESEVETASATEKRQATHDHLLTELVQSALPFTCVSTACVCARCYRAGSLLIRSLCLRVQASIRCS